MASVADAEPLLAARRALQAGAAADASRILESALSRARPDGGEAGPEAELAIEAGNALEQSGDPARALARFVHGHALAAASGDAALQLRALLGMAKVEHVLGDSTRAGAHLLEGAALVGALAERPHAVELLHQLGMMHSRLGQFDAAEACLLAAIERAEAGDDHGRLGVSLNSLGVCSLNRGNAEGECSDVARRHFEAALPRFESALAAARSSGDRHLEALVLGNIGTIEGSLGHFAKALERFALQLDALRAMGDRLHEALALTNIGEAHRRRGAPNEALPSLRQALTIAEETASLPRQRAAHAELARVHESMVDFAPALAHFKAFHRLDRQIRSAEAERQAALATARLAVDEARREADAVRRERDSLRDANAALAAEALVDALTGLRNRRSFDRTMARGRRGGGVLALLDLDRFKAINDEHSHPVGDAVLRRLGVLLGEALRPSDAAFRIGGEEFALWLPDSGAAAARRVCERLPAAVEGDDWARLAPGLRVTASFGLAVRGDDERVESLVGRADAALYAAKRDGRNRIVCHGSAAVSA